MPMDGGDVAMDPKVPAISGRTSLCRRILHFAIYSFIFYCHEHRSTWRKSKGRNDRSQTNINTPPYLSCLINSHMLLLSSYVVWYDAIIPKHSQIAL